MHLQSALVRRRVAESLVDNRETFVSRIKGVPRRPRRRTTNERKKLGGVHAVCWLIGRSWPWQNAKRRGAEVGSARPDLAEKWFIDHILGGPLDGTLLNPWHRSSLPRLAGDRTALRAMKQAVVGETPGD